MDRPQPLIDVVSELVRERLAEEIVVNRLSVGDTAEMIRTELEDDPVSNELVAIVHRRADGNPFFIEELIKSLREQDALVRVQGITSRVAWARAALGLCWRRTRPRLRRVGDTRGRGHSAATPRVDEP